MNPGKVGRTAEDAVAGKSKGKGSGPAKSVGDPVAAPGDRPSDAPPPATPGLMDLQPDGPFRPPDYRWQLAGRAAAGAFVPAEWVDAWVQTGQALLACPRDAAAVPPPLAAAAAARELALADPFSRRVEVEARLLAGQPVAAVAAPTGLTAAAVEAYAALFYAVADRLAARSYVVHAVVGLHAAGDAYAAHTRMLCYAGGPVVADAAFDAVADPLLVGTACTPEVAERRRLVRLALEVRAEPVTHANGLRWARLGLLQAKVEAGRPAGRTRWASAPGGGVGRVASGAPGRR
jgi:hypothetical protein